MWCFSTLIDLIARAHTQSATYNLLFLLKLFLRFFSFPVKIFENNRKRRKRDEENLKIWFRQLIYLFDYGIIVFDSNEERSEEMCHDSQCVKRIQLREIARFAHTFIHTHVHKLAERQAWSPLNLAFQETGGEGKDRERERKKTHIRKHRV